MPWPKCRQLLRAVALCYSSGILCSDCHLPYGTVFLSHTLLLVRFTMEG